MPESIISPRRLAAVEKRRQALELRAAAGLVKFRKLNKVRLNSIAAGLIRTEQSHLHYGDEEGIAKVSATVPLGRMASTHDIGDTCLYLASNLSSYVTGSYLTVHGGGEKPSFLDAGNSGN